jgi:hypothetical protein
MTDPDGYALEPTEDQLALLRDLGASEVQLEDLTYEDAEELIAELRALREDAGRTGRE